MDSFVFRGSTCTFLVHLLTKNVHQVESAAKVETKTRLLNQLLLVYLELGSLIDIVSMIPQLILIVVVKRFD